MLKAKGIVLVEPRKGRMVLKVDDDFGRYYNYLIERHYWIRMNTPMHGSHITIFSEKHHKKVNWQKAVYYHKQEVEFEYDPYVIEGGYNKGFLMYYLKVFSSDLDHIKKKLGIVDGERYRGLHITISNSKGNSIYPDWPKTIELTNETLRTKT